MKLLLLFLLLDPTLAWNPPPTPPAAEGYDLYLQSSEGCKMVRGIQTPSYTVPGLTPGVKYKAYVRAYNQCGDSPQSNSITFYSVKPTPTPKPTKTPRP